jgi:hypothetical protein
LPINKTRHKKRKNPFFYAKNITKQEKKSLFQDGAIFKDTAQK